MLHLLQLISVNSSNQTKGKQNRKNKDKVTLPDIANVPYMS